MKLPNADKAQVDEAKITTYLLSESHPDGKSKALFFLEFGFSVAEWEVLAAALRQHTRHEVKTVSATAHGVKYVVEGALAAPDGRTPFIRTVWIAEADSAVPRLVTAYPLKG